VSDKYNVYRAYAAFCERMSRESQGEDRRLSWLQLAADWLALIRDSSSAEQESGLTGNDGTRSADGQHAPPSAAPDASSDH
jgi:hypothetical protein